MRDQAIGQPGVRPLALAEPAEHVRYRWIVGLTLASLGMWMASQTPLQVVLALQLQDITPRHKIVALGVVTGVGAISSALATVGSVTPPNSLPPDDRAPTPGPTWPESYRQRTPDSGELERHVPNPPRRELW
jgi:hypothetical protein